jgi:hypothetical protein
MPLPHATEAEPTGPALPATGNAEPGVHRHGRSCFWRIDEARWSCDRSELDSDPSENPLTAGH